MSIRQEWRVYENDVFDLDYIADYLRNPSKGLHTEIINDSYVRLVTNSATRREFLPIQTTYEEVT